MLKFPVVGHHRVIVNAAEKDVAKMQELFADFDLVEPLSEARSSSGGKYASFAVSVRFQDAAEMSRFDERLKLIPGLKMVL